ncbi:hypothetical protein DXG01_011929 [Tephrocybe rancida]|nr:hypothetical protein DXG01_011929 [Tephrocybe rancida]
MTKRSSVPPVLLEQLKLIEPHAEFNGFPPRVQSSSGAIYFVKCGTSAEKEQYIGEVESLKAIDAAAPGLAPRVISSGVGDANQPFFVSEYKDLHRLGEASAKALATRLALELHAYGSEEGFGFHVPTYCGVTRLRNGWFHRWDECYDSMMGDLVMQLRAKRAHDELCNLTDQVRQRLVRSSRKSV